MAGAGKRKYMESQDPEIPVRMFLLREYARADVSTPEVFFAMMHPSLHYINQSTYRPIPRFVHCVDTLPLILAQEWYYGPPFSIRADNSN